MSDPYDVSLLPAPVAPPADHSILWTAVVVIAGLLVLARLFVKLRSAAKGAHKEGWDEREIERLRRQGYVPFKEYPVDFFLALPDEAASQAVRQLLEPAGFTIDVKRMEDDPSLHYSLHAVREMKLIVPQMEEQTKRLAAIAEQFHGRYDGWAAGPQQPPQKFPPFVVEPLHLGVPRVSFDRPGAVLDQTEGAGHR